MGAESEREDREGGGQGTEAEANRSSDIKLLRYHLQKYHGGCKVPYLIHSNSHILVCIILRSKP